MLQDSRGDNYKNC